MKILSILTYYYPHWTGLTAHAVRVNEELAARGHEVTVLTIRYTPELARDETIKGVRVIRLQPVSRFSRGMITPAFPEAAARLIRDHDVVQIHTPLPEALVVAGLCRLQGRPLLMTHHGDIVMPPGLGNRAIELAALGLLRMTARLADAVTSYSQDYARQSRVLRGFGAKLECIYPPVEIPDPDPAEVAAWRARLGLGGRQLIGFAGRWVQEKGFDYLLQALPRVREVYPDAHLVYAGDPHVIYEDFYERCRPLIAAQQDHLTFLGLLRGPQEMANFYGLCDLFALPSRTDMMALVQIEAMLCGTPVVASDIPGARVVIQETGFGRLTRPRDPEALARTIVEVLGDRPRFQPNRERVRAVFSTERTIARYEGVMARIIRREATVIATPALPRTAGENGRQGGAPPARVGYRPLWLSREDHATIDCLLRNEADMAYRRRARAMLEYLELKDGDRVFDCGCGMGFYLLAMSRLRRLQLVGLDGDLDRLRWARRERVPGHLLSGDIQRLPFANETFDAVLMTEVLEHLPDDRRALGEIWRILRPGGVLALSVPHARYPFWWDPINRVWTGLGGTPLREGPLVGIWTKHERLYARGELTERIADAGFAVEAAEEATHYSFPFSHFLLYGVGKPLIEKNLLPGRLRASADRLRPDQNGGGSFNPISLGIAAFRAIDRLNEQPAAARKDTFVNLLVKARKPNRD